MEIEVNYEPDFRDYFRAVRHIALKRFRFLLVVLVALPLALVLFTVTEPQRSDRPVLSSLGGVWSMLLIPAGLVLVMYAGAYYSSRKQWAKASDLREPRRIIVTEKGLDVKGSTFSGQTEWTNIAAGEKFRDLYLLRTRGGAYYILPERSFSSDIQIQEFLTITNRRLGRSFRG